jgi:hypothetical protein
VALVLVMDKSIVSIPPALPTWWLVATSDDELPLGAMAVVSPSIAVHTAMRGFAIRNSFSGKKVRVRSFKQEEPALVWAHQFLTGATPSMAGGKPRG